MNKIIKHQWLLKVIILFFFVLHISAIALYLFHPYANRFLHAPPPHRWLAKIEQPLLTWITDHDENSIIKLLNRYVKLTGTHQYWGFFAPDVPLSHNYLRVCDKVIKNTQNDRIECIGIPLYKSYDGTLKGAIYSYNGNRGRSFRLTENLVGLNHLSFFQQLTDFWCTQNQDRQKASYNQCFLILSEYSLFPMAKEKDLQHLRKDQILWGE